MSFLSGRRTALVALAIASLVSAACTGAATSPPTSATAPPASATAPSSTAPEPTDAPASEAPTDAPTGAPSEPAAEVALTLLVDDTQASIDTADGVIAAFTAEHPNISIEVETRPGGTEGDNIVKTRLATGSMNDLFFYNSGSLFQALDPTESMVDLSGDALVENLADVFLPTVSAGDGIYGVPYQTAMGGGVLYNKQIYADLDLAVPTTWAEFASNNDAILAAGTAPVGQSYGTTWTSQLFVLADYYNVQQAVPDFAESYTANGAKYATTPAALAGFQHLQEGFEKGWYQEDFGATTFEDALILLADGDIAHYPMLSFPLSTIAANTPEAIENIGFFAQPGDDAATNGATIWLAAACYVAATTQHVEEAKQFVAFMASPEGVEAITAAVPPTGPYVTKGAELPADVFPAVNDIQAYIDDNRAGPALEFLSPLKGPSLEQITVAVGSGLTSAEEGAAQYDEDVRNQAEQLGLPGW